MKTKNELLLKAIYLCLLQEAFMLDLHSRKLFYRYDTEGFFKAIDRLLSFYTELHDVIRSVNLSDDFFNRMGEDSIALALATSDPLLIREVLILQLPSEHVQMGESLNAFFISNHYKFSIREERMTLYGGVNPKVDFLLKDKEILSPSKVFIDNLDFLKKILNGEISKEDFCSTEYFLNKLKAIPAIFKS